MAGNDKRQLKIPIKTSSLVESGQPYGVFHLLHLFFLVFLVFLMELH